ncbi:hypothetical protein Goshw_017219 [Gossypium schwendimanii]|uniref:Uncharacterized protein n=2 Tax=Gossypium TaxID=3633 RepID=A0A7J9NAC7_GOSSC|nr:hypothetical protein [Gossypium lobatum]MBA0880283.1 hypothetical protein [Gossypium schwendimanii]
MVLERNHEFCIGCILELVLQYKCLHHLQPVKPFFRQNREAQWIELDNTLQVGVDCDTQHVIFCLFFTYLGLYLMNGNGQPALLYLVPCTLGVTVVLAAIRGDLKALWGYSSKSSAMINPTAEV